MIDLGVTLFTQAPSTIATTAKTRNSTPPIIVTARSDTLPMERFQHTANLLSVVQTCRRQRRSVIDFFVQALKAHFTGSSISPSLIPPSST